MGPNGDLYYADVGRGTIQRIRAINPNQAPTAAFTATPTAAPRRCTSASTPPARPTRTATRSSTPGTSTATAPTTTRRRPRPSARTQRGHGHGPAARHRPRRLGRHRDDRADGRHPADGDDQRAGRRHAPTASATASTSAARATAPTARRPEERLLWTVDLNHCSALVPTNCHVHHMTNYVGVDSGFLTYPDHEYPSYVTLTLTATEASGLRGTASVRINPKTVELSFNSTPPGLLIGVGGEATAAPFTRTVAQGSTVGVARRRASPRRASPTTSAPGRTAARRRTSSPRPRPTRPTRVTYTETPCPVRDGLVGAWGFDETSGDAPIDTSGRDNPGTISGAARTTAGRFGAALSFDGLDDLVEVKDSNSLDAVGGVTIEGWVNPNELGSSWRTVAMKEQSGGLVYALYATTARPHQRARRDAVRVAHDRLGASAEHLDARRHHLRRRRRCGCWSTASRSSMPVTGALSVSNGELHIGGNEVWSEWFSGLIDELRVYDRALTPAEVRVDMTRPITCVSDPRRRCSPSRPAAWPSAASRAARARGQDARDRQRGRRHAQLDRVRRRAVAERLAGAGSGAGTVTVTPSITSLSPGTYSATSRSARPARPASQGRPGHADRHRAAARSRAGRHARHAGLQRPHRAAPARRPRRSTWPTAAAGRCPGPCPTTPPGSPSPRQRDERGDDHGHAVDQRADRRHLHGHRDRLRLRRDRLAAGDPGDLHRRSAAAAARARGLASTLAFSATAGAPTVQTQGGQRTNTGGGTLTFTPRPTCRG